MNKKEARKIERRIPDAWFYVRPLLIDLLGQIPEDRVQPFLDENECLQRLTPQGLSSLGGLHLFRRIVERMLNNDEFEPFRRVTFREIAKLVGHPVPPSVAEELRRERAEKRSRDAAREQLQ